MLMNTLDRYIGKSILGAIFATLFTLVGLSAIIKFVEQFRSVGKGSYDIWQAVAYTGLTMPKDVETFFPMAALLGALIALGNLASRSELVVMQSAGFSRVSPIGSPVTLEDFMQPGNKQVAAGYIVYGSSTMLVYTTGHGVNGFTYDPSIGTFCLSHENMQMPKEGKIYSINEGQYLKFPQGVKKYIKYCQEEDKATNRPYTSRYIGSLVADFHRNLLKGGIYIYPSATNYPNGKLRLLYEGNPIAFLAEQAGGIASDGYNRILDIQPTELHQRVPLFVGSAEMVKKAEEMMREFKED